MASEGENVGTPPGGTPRAARPARTSGEGRKERTGAIQFIHECWAELQRVQWPNRSQLWQATAVVILVCLIVGLYIAALDSVLARVSKWLIDQYAAN
jgi:preprotein translocase SecE subunit